MRIAFVLDRLGVRGVEAVAWAYAHLAETVLGHESVVVVVSAGRDPANPDETPEAERRFAERFPCHRARAPGPQVDDLLLALGVDVAYRPCSGGPDCWLPLAVPCVAHCVFTTRYPLPHALRLGISESVAAQGGVGCLPNVVLHAPRGAATTPEEARAALGVPPDAEAVFGRYGGHDTFDIPWAQDAVRAVAAARPRTYFVFMHTRRFCTLPNVLHFDATCDLEAKRRFVDACDAMLHARRDGETFGLACGEFALAGKPVLTWAGGEGEHRALLGEAALVYRDRSELEGLLARKPAPVAPPAGYERYLPDGVMPEFERAVRAAAGRSTALGWP